MILENKKRNSARTYRSLQFLSCSIIVETGRDVVRKAKASESRKLQQNLPINRMNLVSTPASPSYSHQEGDTMAAWLVERPMGQKEEISTGHGRFRFLLEMENERCGGWDLCWKMVSVSTPVCLPVTENMEEQATVD